MLHNEHTRSSSPVNYSQVFSVKGVIGPIQILTGAECALVNAYVDSGELEEPATWFKGYACSDSLIFSIATKPNVLDIVGQLLGPHLYLWGASIVVRAPGQAHHWHTDIET